MFALADYESVLALATEAHFGRAARRLGVTQPALSARLRRVEQALGAQLFRRDRSGVRATAAGLAFIAGAERVVAAAAETTRAVRDAQSGFGQTIRIGMTQVAAYQIVAPALSAFRRAHPSLRLRLTEATTISLERMLEAQTVDAAFLHPPLHAPGLSERRLASVAMTRFDWGSDGPRRPLVRYPRAEAPVLMGELARRLADDHDAGDRLPAAEADTMLGALTLSHAGFGPFTAPADFPSRLSPPSRADVGVALDTAIAWRSLDRRPLVNDLVEAAETAAKAAGTTDAPAQAAKTG